MATIHDPIDHLIRSVDARGDTRRGHLAVAVWAQAEPLLSRWSSAGEIASACRRAPAPDHERTVAALIRVAAGDELAQLTVISCMAGRLRQTVAAWARGGAAAGELPGLEAELITECWAAVSVMAASAADGVQLPPRPASALVDEARERVRVPRRRERRASTRLVGFPVHLVAACGRPTAELLSREISDAVRARRITVAAARPVFLTRVVGLGTAEAAVVLGCTPAVLRAVRSRTERALTRAA